MNQSNETVVFGGGCFWCYEAIFSRLKGVGKVVSGYAGGTKENPTYDEVCTGRTENAEVIQITFDPSVISFKTLLEVFFNVHDPTVKNRQGADEGSQYRSIILFTTPEQKIAAETYIAKLTADHIFPNPIVTEIKPLGEKGFYEAEKYHQKYFDTNREQPYCEFVISPKMTKFMKAYKNLLKN